MVRFGLFFLVFIALGSTQASTYYEFSGGYRSFPRSGSGELVVSVNEKLWSGETSEQPWNYGFWRMSGFAAAHGQAGLKIDVYPISIWQLSLQRSITSRFYETQTLNCFQIECHGLLQRGVLKTSIALGYGNIFLVPSYAITDLALDTDARNFSSEEDNLIADKAGDQLATTQIAVGYKLNNQRFVLLHKNSQMKLTKDHNNSQYLVWSKTHDKVWSYFVGAGTFSSNHVAKDWSMVAGLNYSVGENLSFF